MALRTDPNRKEPLDLPKVDRDRLALLRSMETARALDRPTERQVLPAPSPLEEVAQVKRTMSRLDQRVGGLEKQGTRIEVILQGILDELGARPLIYPPREPTDGDLPLE